LENYCKKRLTHNCEKGTPQGAPLSQLWIRLEEIWAWVRLAAMNYFYFFIDRVLGEIILTNVGLLK